MSDPKAWSDRFFGIALTILFGALALYVAAQLILAAWTILLVTAAVLLGGVLAVCAVRVWCSRTGTW